MPEPEHSSFLYNESPLSHSVQSFNCIEYSLVGEPITLLSMGMTTDISLRTFLWTKGQENLLIELAAALITKASLKVKKVTVKKVSCHAFIYPRFTAWSRTETSQWKILCNMLNFSFFQYLHVKSCGPALRKSATHIRTDPVTINLLIFTRRTCNSGTMNHPYPTQFGHSTAPSNHSKATRWHFWSEKVRPPIYQWANPSEPKVKTTCFVIWNTQISKGCFTEFCAAPWVLVTLNSAKLLHDSAWLHFVFCHNLYIGWLMWLSISTSFKTTTCNDPHLVLYHNYLNNGYLFCDHIKYVSL